MRAPGLVSDVQLYEDYPSRYAAGRQAPPSLDPRRLADRAVAAAAVPVRRIGARRAQSAVGAVAREDLRQPAPQPGAGRAAALLVLGWTVLAQPLAVDGWRARRSCFVPPLLASLGDVLQQARATCRWRSTWSQLRRRPARQSRAARWSRWPACRTRPSSASTRSRAPLWRLLVTRRGCCEWRPVQRSRAHAPATGIATASCAAMWIAPALARRGAGAALAARAARRAAASPRRSCCCGSSSPALDVVAEPPGATQAHRAVGDADALPAPAGAPHLGVLRSASSAPSNHWLPPDNIQEHPVAIVAHRTSPTNIGLALLANLSALRLRLHLGGETDRAHVERRLTTLAGLRALPRPLLQLVRHADAAAAAAALRLHGRQRQPVPATC